MELIEVPKCPKHPKYNGFRRNRNFCDVCEKFYIFQKDSGVKETRTKYPKYNEILERNL